MGSSWIAVVALAGFFTVFSLVILLLDWRTFGKPRGLGLTTRGMIIVLWLAWLMSAATVWMVG